MKGNQDRPVGLVGMGSRFTRLRLHAGLTQGELAGILGTSKSRLSKLENDHQAVSFSMLERLAVSLPFRTEAVLLYCLEAVYPDLLAPRTMSIARGLVEQGRS